MKKTKLLITATIVATVLTATACGGKNQASTATEAQTTTVVVKQVNSTSTEKATDKQEVTEASVENTEASNEEVLVAEAVTDENQGNSDSVEEVNNTVPEEQPAENTNAGWTDTTPAEQPVEEAPVEDTNSGAVEEAPVENNNSSAVEETPVEQPVAPEPTPEPETNPNTPWGNVTYMANGVLQYGENADVSVRGKDVNTGADVSCPYQLDTITTRVMYDTYEGFHTYEGYYVATNETVPFLIAASGTASPLYEQYQKQGYDCIFSGRIGVYSCGNVVFTAMKIVD